METLTEIFTLPLTTYGACAALAMFASLFVMGIWSMKNSIRYSTVILTCVLGVMLGWLMSRVTFVCCSYKLYLGDVPLVKALNFWDGGYSMVGACFGLLLAVWLGSKLTGSPCGVMMDGLAIGLPVALIIARLAERGTGLNVGWYIEEGWPAVGLLVEAEYGMAHAIYLYEAIAAVIIFLCVLLEALRMHRRSGSAMLTFTLLFGATQVFFESLRDDGHMEIHMGVHMQQVFAAVMVVLAVIIWAVQAYKSGALKPAGLATVLIAAAVMVGVAIVAEFGVDRWDSKVLAYGSMIVCLAGLVVLGVICRDKADRTARS